MKIRLFQLLTFLLFVNCSLFAQENKILGEWELVEARENGRVFYAQQKYENEPKETLAFFRDGTYRKVHESQSEKVWEGEWQERGERRLGFINTVTDGQRIPSPNLDEQWKIEKISGNMLQIVQLTEFGEPRFVYTYYRKE